MFSSGSRHNVGSDALIRVAQAANLQWTTMRDISCYVAVDHALQVTYLRPKSAMNDSGKPVRKALQHFRATAAECLVVHDDLERAVGKVSVKAGGGAAGHNGIRSITQCLGTESFPRLRVGIGRPADRSQVANFVLESFTPDESEVLRTTLAPPHDVPPLLKSHSPSSRVLLSQSARKFSFEILKFTLRSFVEVLRLIQLHVSHSDAPCSHQPVASCLARGNRLFTPLTCLWITARLLICRCCQICRHCRCSSPREHQQVPDICTR